MSIPEEKRPPSWFKQKVEAMAEAAKMQAQPGMATDFHNQALAQLRKRLAENPEQAQEIHEAACQLMKEMSGGSSSS